MSANTTPLRPECCDARPGDGIVHVPRDTALYLIRDAVDRRKGLIHGALHRLGGHCALGCYWKDNPRTSLDTDLINEISTVNDSLGPKASAKERWEMMRGWLRFKVRALVLAQS